MVSDPYQNVQYITPLHSGQSPDYHRDRKLFTLHREPVTREMKLRFQPCLPSTDSPSHLGDTTMPPSPHNHNAINPSRSSCNFPSTAQPSCKCSLLAPKRGWSAGCTTLCCTKEIIANVFAGDAIFTQECQIPFLQHFFPLFSVRLVIISCPV